MHSSSLYTRLQFCRTEWRKKRFWRLAGRWDGQTGQKTHLHTSNYILFHRHIVIWASPCWYTCFIYCTILLKLCDLSIPVYVPGHHSRRCCACRTHCDITWHDNCIAIHVSHICVDTALLGTKPQCDVHKMADVDAEARRRPERRRRRARPPSCSWAVLEWTRQTGTGGKALALWPISVTALTRFSISTCRFWCEHGFGVVKRRVNDRQNYQILSDRQVLLTVNDHHRMGSDLLIIVGRRLAHFVLVCDPAGCVEKLSRCSPSISTWLKSLVSFYDYIFSMYKKLFAESEWVSSQSICWIVVSVHMQTVKHMQNVFYCIKIHFPSIFVFLPIILSFLIPIKICFFLGSE